MVSRSLVLETACAVGLVNGKNRRCYRVKKPTCVVASAITMAVSVSRVGTVGLDEGPPQLAFSPFLFRAPSIVQGTVQPDLTFVVETAKVTPYAVSSNSVGHHCL